MRSKLCSLLPLVALAFSTGTSRGKEKSVDTPCIDDNRFYRNPNAPARNVWSTAECAKYYLCLDNEVFEFRCSQGLLFDVSRQVCDFKANVDNCDVASEAQPPRPLFENGDCDDKHLACGDGTCFPAAYFCDGSVDCPDGSDEGWCDAQNDPNGALPCDPKNCQLPNCWCSEDGTRVPGNLTVSMVPQMITITFDGAVNADNIELYSKMFSDDRKNPNGCPVRGTFYVSHQYTNYRDVQYLWNVGHEIAAHSVTHRGPEDWWSRNATIEDWFDEMVGVANIINKYGGVRLKDMKGSALQLLRLDVPSIADPRWDKVALTCEYDLAGEELYSVKWYKDGAEFFRFMPGSKPTGRDFPVDGVYVDVNRSDSKQVTLQGPANNRRGKVHLVGSYGCEVSSEGPSFLTIYGEANMSVAILPKKQPTLRGLRPSYEAGEILRAECTSAPSYPPAILGLVLNGKEVNKAWLKELPSSDPSVDDIMSSSRLGLSFRLERHHFPGGTLTLTCQSILPDIPGVRPLQVTGTATLAASNQRLAQEPPRSGSSFNIPSPWIVSCMLAMVRQFYRDDLNLPRV